NVTIEGLKLPTQAIYNIHPDITANALIETDSAFTNRKKFVSSEFMLNALANDPDRRMKRLGDGFYEQGLINSQILSATGKPYLEGYTDNESEYKALLEAGISYGKKYKLTPGITLSEEQMKAITTDMVWLETKTIVVNGQSQQVLYPKVYLAKQSANQIDAMGAVVSGKSIIANTDSAFKNSGNMMADSIVVQANTVDNTGRFNANTVAIGATDSIRNTGAIHGNDSVILRANNDISVEAATHKLANQDVLMQQGRIGVSNPKGTIDIHSNKDVHLTGAIITGGDEGNISITSANTVNLDTKKLSAKKDMTLNAANYLRTDRGTEIGTQILGDGNVTVAAKNDVNIRQGVINSEHGVTTIAAGNDVNIENGNTYSRDQYGLQYKEKGLLSRTVNTIRKDYEHTGVTASTIGGNTIQVGANHDVNVIGSNVLGTGDVAISAGNKVRTNSAEDSSRNDIYQHSKKKGLMGAGLGFTIGSKQIKDTEAESYTTNVNTLIGSVDGTIAVNANNDAHITSTDIVGKHGITVSAADITLDGNHDVAMSKQVHEEKQSGLTVSLGGSIASALNTAHGLQRKASSRNDKRLATLENIEAGKELKKGYEQIKEYQEFTPEFVKRRAESLIDSSKIKKGYVAEIDKELKNPNLSDKEIRRLEKDRNRLEQEANQEHAEGTNDLQDINSKDQKQYNAKKRAKKDGLANIHVSIGSSKSRSETTLNSRNYAGGQLVSDEDIVLVAKPNMQDKGNIVAVGETIRGKSVALEASNDISLLAATNTSEKQVAYDSKGWSIGANLSVNGGGLLGLDANYNQGMERGNTLKTTHTGTVIQADQVNLHSGKDTTIAGSKVYGDSVTAEIGGNLAIKSLQDTETYRGKSKNVGFSVSTNGLQLGSVSAEYTNGTMKSDYASVTDQAGIYAGTGGFAIQSKGNTTLEGAVIGSKATADKNSLVTDSLTIKDIKNKAEYTSRNTGLSYTSVSGFKNLSQAGKDAVYNSLGLLPKLLPDSSKSSESTTKSAIANGTIKTQSSNIDIDKISRDTESSLNKLDTIFDKKKVEERQELARLFAKDAFEQLHYWKPKTKEEKVAKALAHAVVAESSARIAGNPAGSGFYAGLSNEALIGEIQKISKTNPAVAQWLSAALGAVVNGALVKPMVTGATEAQYGTKWNSYGLLIPKPLFGSLSRGMVTDMPGNISVMGEIHIEQATGESTSSSASDPSTPMDDVIPPGPEFSNSDVLQPPVVISTKKPILTDLPPKTDPYTGKVSIWNVEKQQYEEMDNLYKFNGKEAFDQGGSDEFGRAIFVEKESGQLIYGVNKSKVYLYRGSDGKPDWRIVSPDNKFVKIGKYDGSASEHLKTTLGDNNMLYNSNATVVFNASTHSLVNSNTGNALSKIGFKYFKNNISLDTISKNDLDNLQWDNDSITVMVKDKDSITDRIIFENMDSNGYKYSDKVINGYKTGVIEPGKVEPTEKPEFNLGVENLNFDNGLGGIVDSWNGVSIKGGVKANLAKINMREWSGYDFWGDTKASVFEGNIGGKVQINKSGLTLGANSGFNFVKLQPKYSYDMNGTKYKVESEFIYGFNAEGEGHIGYNGKGINVSGIIGKPTIGAGVNVKGGVENENGEITIYEYDSNKKNKSK
uniref:hemagglutinin repeat-containing protein n=1 Tax=Gemella sanguinis TaxID=84135 RepID=UPI0028E43D8E